MKKKIKQYYATGIFGLFFLISSSLLFLHTPSEFSLTERRPLATFPELSKETVQTTEFMQNFERYTLDQFPFREAFRQLKAQMQFHVFQKKESNQLFIANDYISKLDYPLNENSLTNIANKLTKIDEQLLKPGHTKNYFAIVPDKNYYLAQKNEIPTMDYQKMQTFLVEKTPTFTPIDLFSALKQSDYYLSDTHWKQESLTFVINQLAKAMQFTPANLEQYTAYHSPAFYGVYAGQAALPFKGETLTYLYASFMEQVTVKDPITQQKLPIYNQEKLKDKDAYELFLNGAKPLLVLENPVATSNKELIIFRDSFASSLAPLLLESYRKITLVDLRYFPTEKLSEYVTFNQQDVLFLLSTLVLNHSQSLK